MRPLCRGPGNRAGGCLSDEGVLMMLRIRLIPLEVYGLPHSSLLRSASMSVSDPACGGRHCQQRGGYCCMALRGSFVERRLSVRVFHQGVCTCRQPRVHDNNHSNSNQHYLFI